MTNLNQSLELGYQNPVAKRGIIHSKKKKKKMGKKLIKNF